MYSVPNLFIVGMPRSGTTTLYSYLKQHPEIYLSVLKEPNFFCKEYFKHPSVVYDFETYQGLFSHVKSEKCIGEGSVWYLYLFSAAKKINEYNSNAKSVILLRNPVDMIISLHSLYLRTGNEDVAELEKAIELEETRANGKNIPSSCYFPSGLNYSKIGQYFNHIKNYLQLFTKESIHYIVFDEFLKNTNNELIKLFKFLNIRHDVYIETNPGKIDRIIRHDVLNQLRNSDEDIRKKIRYKMGKYHLGNKTTIVTDSFKSSLKLFFKDDIIKTEQLTGLNLHNWYC